ncbi:MAG: hypothetical protein PHQ35_05460 [Phycisphaerae bacterium]|nr:hypothetical protein [Phycisphaerae bacterium]MDD5380837.1 hypothetical protein [Phycisphaerae bacterium]
MKEKGETMIAKYVLTILLLLLPAFLISCTSQIPIATNYPYTEQQKMQAPHHWDVLAAEVVEQLNLNRTITNCTPIFVVPKFHLPSKEDPAIWTATKPLAIADESDRLATIPFKRAYQNYLVTQLVNAGYNVVDDSRAAELVMTFDIQLVKHGNRPVRSPHIMSKIGRVFTGSADGAYVGVEASPYEVVITTSVKKGSTYVISHTGTYYIDTPLWDSSYALQGKTMEVVSQ